MGKEGVENLTIRGQFHKRQAELALNFAYFELLFGLKHTPDVKSISCIRLIVKHNRKRIGSLYCSRKYPTPSVMLSLQKSHIIFFLNELLLELRNTHFSNLYWVQISLRFTLKRTNYLRKLIATLLISAWKVFWRAIFHLFKHL